ncbi:serine/threonine protein kinase [Burkholderia glumae]|uniref:serine/threonine protein kinase n=1 Tax=Burkholderia glumae TaxID=337 RepID=UPI001570B69F|nr:serine/threonine protein kinase [Burkholderia glumae]
MSDNIVWVVDVEASLDEVPMLVDRGISWLVENAIVRSVPESKNALGGGDLYRPGPRAAAWSEQVSIGNVWCGVGLRTGRTVFHSGPGPHDVRCPHCGSSHSLGEVPWGDAVSAWFSNEADDTLACPTCGRSARIIDWTFLELDWAFGNLGFGFTNWLIAPRLAVELGEVLGHRTKIVHQHI